VTNVAGRDIIQHNATSVHVLHLLETTVAQSDSIPEPEKTGLLQRICGLIEEPYIAGIASNVIFGGLKRFFRGNERAAAEFSSLRS
jgi:hypothetical protein